MALEVRKCYRCSGASCCWICAWKLLAAWTNWWWIKKEIAAWIINMNSPTCSVNRKLFQLIWISERGARCYRRRRKSGWCSIICSTIKQGPSVGRRIVPTEAVVSISGATMTTIIAGKVSAALISATKRAVINLWCRAPDSSRLIFVKFKLSGIFYPMVDAILTTHCWVRVWRVGPDADQIKMTNDSEHDPRRLIRFLNLLHRTVYTSVCLRTCWSSVTLKDRHFWAWFASDITNLALRSPPNFVIILGVKQFG